MGWLVLVLVLLHLAVLLLWRAHVVLRKRGMPLAAGPRRTIALVVLGSGACAHASARPPCASASRHCLVNPPPGGHTTEMVKLMGGLGMAEADVLHFVLAHSDEASGSHAWAWIVRCAGPRATGCPRPHARVLQEKHGVPAGRVHFHRVHRAREVGQSWLSTYWTSLRALLHCLLITARARPNFLLLNGPGMWCAFCILRSR